MLPTSFLSIFIPGIIAGLLAGLWLPFRLPRRLSFSRRVSRASLLEALIDAIPNPVYCKDLQNRYVECNHAFAQQVFGRTKGAVLGKTLPELDPDIPPERLAFLHEQDRILYERGGTQSFAYEVRFADASQHTILFNKACFRGPHGQVAGIAGIMLDLTQNRKTEEALRRGEQLLRESQKQLNAIFDNAACGIGVLDRSGIYIRINHRWAEMLQRPIEEVVGHSPLEFTYPDELEDSKRNLDALLSGTCATYRVEKRFVRADGRPFWAEVSAEPVQSPDGEIESFVGTIFDITDRKQAEQEKARLEAQLRESQKMEAIGQLAGGIAHDFNNVLSIILGNIALLQRELGLSNPGVVPELEQMQHAAERAVSLTRQLLTFSRRQTTVIEPTDLNQLVAGLQKMLKGLLGEHVALEVSLAPNLPPIMANGGQLEQVIINLSLNARDAMPAGGILAFATDEVTLTASYRRARGEVPPGSYVRMTVRDSGSGMSKDVLEHLFEPFFTTKAVGQGTGLGLATVYGIVHQFNGCITVESNPAAGSTFELYFPVCRAKASESAVMSVRPVKLDGHETILVCEDDEGVRNLAVEILQQAGYYVISAPDAAQALEISSRFPARIDLLLTDVIMPQMNGKELSENLSTQRPELRTLFVSGYASSVIASQGIEQSSSPFLEKPFKRDSLLEKVRLTLDS